MNNMENLSKSYESDTVKMHDMLDEISSLSKKYSQLYSAHEATLIWKRMQDITSKMHEIKYIAQVKHWGLE